MPRRLYEHVPKVMVPMFWFTQRAALTEELANQARMAILAPSLGVYVAYGMASFGAILLLVGAVLQCTNSWGGTQSTQFHNAGDDDDELRQ